MGNVHVKLAKARVMLQNTELKMSAENTHLNFKYFELKDILPAINNINEEVGIVSIVDFPEDRARIRIIDCETGEEITFDSPTDKATLRGGATPVQELGSMHTYMRRYMYNLAYEISDIDVQNAQQAIPKTKEEIAEEKRLAKEQKEKEIAAMREFCEKGKLKFNITDEKIKALYGDTIDKLEQPELKSFIKDLNRKSKQSK